MAGKDIISSHFLQQQPVNIHYSTHTTTMRNTGFNDDETMATIDSEDIDDNGNTIFDLIDRENSRYMKQKGAIRGQLDKEYFHHTQNMQAIWQSFGVQVSFDRNSKPPKLSTKRKKYIKEKVRVWSLTHPQSACKLGKMKK